MTFEDVFFHIGHHKTGTTWLQTNLFSREAGRTIEYTKERSLLRGSFSNPRFGEFSPEEALETLAPILDTARARGRPVVLSDEVLTGFPFGDRFRRGVTLQRISETLPGATVMITIREQVRVLYSVYGHYLRGGGTATLENFLLQPEEAIARIWTPIADLDYYNYEKTLRLCQKLFGEDRVVMVPMEWMIAEPDRFVQLLSDRIGVDWTEVTIENADKTVNPAWSDIAYTAARLLNHLQTGIPRWKVQEKFLRPNSFASRVDRLTPPGMRDRQKALQFHIIAEAVGDRYADSNRVVSETLGIDLQRFGYRMPG